MQDLPIGARLYVGAVLAAGLVVLVAFIPHTIGDPALFVALLLFSSLASALKVSLPLTKSGSSMSVSYAVDFAALLLLGANETMIVAAASDLDTARRSLASGPVDLVVTDIDLGPTKGFALFDELTAGERPAFLFVTGDVLNQSLLNEAAKRRAPLLAKPFLRTDFLRAVRRAVAKARARKA